MKTILVISCITCCLTSYDLLSHAAEFSESAQKFCLDSLRITPHATDLRTALLCGQRSSSSSLLESQLTKHSLIHLLVVSGLHLLIVVKSLRWSLAIVPTKFAGFLLTCAVLFFVLLAGSGPPLLRAAVGMSTAAVAARCRLALSPLRLCWLSGILCLCLSPTWLSSYSFMLSWLAATALALVSELKIKSPLIVCSVVYALLVLPLTAWGVPHPLSILSNALMAAPLGFFLLLGAFISFSIPALNPLYIALTDQLSELLFRLGGPLITVYRGASDDHFRNVFCVYILAIYLCWEAFELVKRRRLLVCS